MIRGYGLRSFGVKNSSHSGLGQKNKETLKKGLKAGLALGALVGGVALADAGVKHATEQQRSENRSDLLGNLSPMKGPIEKTPAYENLPEKPIFAPEPKPLLTPAPAVGPASGKDVAKVAVKGLAGVVAGKEKIGGVVKDVAGVVADKGTPEGQNIIDQIRQVEIDAKSGSSKAVGSADASVKDLARIGARKIKKKVPNPLNRK